jgi:hypothetical protein
MLLSYTIVRLKQLPARQALPLPYVSHRPASNRPSSVSEIPAEENNLERRESDPLSRLEEEKKTVLSKSSEEYGQEEYPLSIRRN